MAGNKVKEFISRHYRYFIVGGLFVVLVVVLIIFMVRNRGNASEADTEAAAAVPESSIEVPKDKYEENAYPAVNTMLESYFNAMASGDADTMASLSNTMTDEERIRIQIRAEYYEGFSNYQVYTKKGPEENSYFALVTYDIVFTGTSTPAPALSSVYVCTNDAGALYVNKEDPTEDQKAYFQALSVQDDFVKLCEDVEVNYNKALESDETLASLMPTMKDEINQKVKDQMAAEQQAAAEAAAAAEAEAQAAQAAAAATMVRATDVVNIRASASTEAEALGKAAIGDEYTRYEEMDNGWSKIDYNGQEAYIKTEFLEVVGGAATAEGDAAATEGGTAEGDTAAAAPTGGKVTVKENVNIRGTASETGEKLGVAYRGEQFDLIETANGWCKIKYKDQEAFVKADFVE